MARSCDDLSLACGRGSVDPELPAERPPRSDPEVISGGHCLNVKPHALAATVLDLYAWLARVTPSLVISNGVMTGS